jgi:hypothetical protein
MESSLFAHLLLQIKVYIAKLPCPYGLTGPTNILALDPNIWHGWLFRQHSEFSSDVIFNSTTTLRGRHGEEVQVLKIDIYIFEFRCIEKALDSRTMRAATFSEYSNL